MKIALVDPYDFAYPGGVTNHVISLSRHLSGLGHEVKIIAPSSRRNYIRSRIPFIRIGTPRPIPANGSMVRITLSMSLGHRIQEVFEEEKFDIVHLHEPLMPTLCTTVLRLSDTVNVGTFHAIYENSNNMPGGPFDGYNFGRPISTVLLKKWVQNLHGRIAVSRPAREFAGKYFPGDYSIIPNGIDLSRFHENIEPIPEFCDGKLNILFVGRLEKRKGFKYLLKAYQKVKQECDNCRLIVVGPGTHLRHRFEDQIAFENIPDVVFAGFVSNDDLPRFYRTAHVYCAPATSCESFGIVLLEAMAVGTPIIASDIAGYASILNHLQEGLLVAPKDEEALAAALIALLQNKPLREEMGTRGLAKAREYGWENVTRRILDFYTGARNTAGHTVYSK